MVEVCLVLTPAANFIPSLMPIGLSLLLQPSSFLISALSPCTLGLVQSVGRPSCLQEAVSVLPLHFIHENCSACVPRPWSFLCFQAFILLIIPGLSCSWSQAFLCVSGGQPAMTHVWFSSQMVRAQLRCSPPI